LPLRRAATLALALAAVPAVAPPPAFAQRAAAATAPAEGVVRQRSAFVFDETVRRLRAEIEAKGVRFFTAIDQAALGREADLEVPRSTPLLFGNPPLGVQFLQSNPYAGLDWPVRMLVVEDRSGGVWIAWADFRFIAHRYRIADRDAQFAMASEVAASIAGAASR
jgi:uncharacterized protein (DUF302 family)